MFQFRAFPAYTYLIQCTLTRYCRAGFPHSDISGSMRMCRSPKLFAACRVLHRLLMPRHSPCALISLTISLVLKELCSSQKNSYRSKIVVVTQFFHNIFSSALTLVPSVALLLLLHCSVFKVQKRVHFRVPSKLNKARKSERTDHRKSVGLVTHMSP